MSPSVFFCIEEYYEKILRIFRFGLIGLTSSGIYALFVHLFVDILNGPPFWGSGGAYILGMAFNFPMQKVFTFKNSERAHGQIGKYLAVHAVNLTVSSAIVYLFSEIFGLPAGIGAIAAVFITAATQYFLLRLWVFNAR